MAEVFLPVFAAGGLFQGTHDLSIELGHGIWNAPRFAALGHTPGFAPLPKAEHNPDYPMTPRPPPPDERSGAGGNGVGTNRPGHSIGCMPVRTITKAAVTSPLFRVRGRHRDAIVAANLFVTGPFHQAHDDRRVNDFRHKWTSAHRYLHTGFTRRFPVLGCCHPPTSTAPKSRIPIGPHRSR